MVVEPHPHPPPPPGRGAPPAPRTLPRLRSHGLSTSLRPRLPGLLLPCLFPPGGGSVSAAGQLIRGQFLEEGAGPRWWGDFISLMDGERSTGGLGGSAPNPADSSWRPRGRGSNVLEGGADRASLSGGPAGSGGAAGRERWTCVLRAPTPGHPAPGDRVPPPDRRLPGAPGSGSRAAGPLGGGPEGAGRECLTATRAGPLPVQLVSWERELDPRSLLIRDERRSVPPGLRRGSGPEPPPPREPGRRDRYIRVADENAP